MRFGILTLAVAAAAALPATGKPADTKVVIVTLKDHQFSPNSIIVPAGERVRIDVTNRDGTADDFDSDDLHVDKDLGPHGHASFLIGPLKPGKYAFKGELHPSTAVGEIIAVKAAQ